MTDDLLTPTDEQIANAFGVDDVDDITEEMLDDVDTPDVPDPVDVSGYKTAAGAAKKTAEVIRAHADAMGYDPDAVRVYDPEETARKRGGTEAWCVAWEGGPNEWAIALTGGESLTALEGPGFGGGDPEVEGLTSGAGFDVECHYSFDLLFF